MAINSLSSAENSLEEAIAQLNIASNTQMSDRDADRIIGSHINNVMEACNEFLLDNRLLTADITREKLNNPRTIIGLANFDSGASAANIGASSLSRLIDAAGVPSHLRPTATRAMNLLLAKFLTSPDTESYMNAHFGHGRQSPDLTNSINSCTSATYAPGVLNLVSDTSFPSMESFGASSDRVLPDIRSAMAVTLLRFLRGIADRIVHRRISSTPYIKYVSQYCEIYDMLKSKDDNHLVRNEHPMRQPLINLYADATPVANELQPLVALKDNDTEDVVLFDGALRINCQANLFDLSRLANEFGKSHTDWTDLVSEGALIDSVIVKFTKGGTSETYQLSVRDVPSSRFNMFPMADDSSDRQATVRYVETLNSESLDITGKKTTLFAAFTDNDYLRVAVNVTSNLRLKTADTYSYGIGKFTGFNSTGNKITSGAETAIEGMTMTLEGVIIDARVSEENLRRSNLAIQTNVRTYDYEVSNGRYILVDYSLQQEAPDNIMKFVSEATSLGQDHTLLDVITHQLLYVYDKNHEEQVAPGVQDRLQTLGFNFVAGMKVRPTVYLATIDLTKVDSIRSSDILGDIRQLVEWQLLNLVSLLHQNSYYKHQLEDSEDPLYKVCTSNIIIDNLLSIPHIHNHLYKDSPATNNTDVEYRRVLPNGTILECISTTFNTMRDKMIIIPFRKNDPESDLNFGHNWDFGNFVGTYTFQYANGVNKRFISNARVQFVHTNPIGLYVQVMGLDTIVNMFAKGRPTKARLPNPSDLVVPQI